MSACKTILPSLLLLVSLASMAQFSDNFADGDFGNAPSWAGDTSRFEVDVSNLLHLNHLPAVSGESYLSTASGAIENASWEFYVEFTFDPSSANFAKVFLVADAPDLTGSLSGYFVRIGGTQDDIRLYLKDGSTESVLIDGVDGAVTSTNPMVRIRVTRDAVGNWELLQDNTGGTSFVSEGTALENSTFFSNYFGVYCKYTSTRSTKFWFDDFIVAGTAFVDTIAPIISDVAVLADSTVSVLFSEPIEATSATSTTNYTVNNGHGNPLSAQQDPLDAARVLLTFASKFGNGVTNSLTITGVKDLAANNIASASNKTFRYIKTSPAYHRAVVFNELMADPSPSAGLPDVEYIELYNRSNRYLDLVGWQFSDGGSPAMLPSYILEPGKFVALCSASSLALLAPFGPALAVNSLPALNNSGDPLQLLDSAGLLIDAVTYTKDWYGAPDKEEGGYSLELINPNTDCTGMNNWAASSHPSGGTPGRVNAVLDNAPDTEGPLLLTTTLLANNLIELQFNERLDPYFAASASYAIVGGPIVTNIAVLAPELTTVVLTISPMLDTNSIQTLRITGVKDCEGNLIDSENAVELVLPASAAPADLLINELLFNPRTGGADFIELYNNSANIIDLHGWQIANFEDDTVANPKDVSSKSYLLFPMEYLVLTEDRDNIELEYNWANADRLFEVANLPSYNDNEGTVFLLSNTGKLIDAFTYSESMHFELLEEAEGVSLERTHFDRASSDLTNWHSAAETIGYATPGYENSQFQSLVSAANEVTIEPPIFSPDNDGYQDQLNISYEFDSPGNVGNVTIYDGRGRPAKLLMQNELLSPKGTLSWNGINDRGEKARIGVYIIYFEVFDLAGKVQRFKKSAVLAGRLTQ